MALNTVVPSSKCFTAIGSKSITVTATVERAVEPSGFVGRVLDLGSKDC